MFGNLLSIAANAIPQQQVTWLQFKERELVRGTWVNTYHEPTSIKGSMQAVDLASYQQLGFDAKRKYWVLYASHPVSSTDRDRAPDVIIYQDKRMEAVGETPWDVDGWRRVHLVEVGV